MNELVKNAILGFLGFCVFVTVVIFVPMAVIWSLNVLFSLQILFTLKTWSAMFFLLCLGFALSGARNYRDTPTKSKQ